MSRGWVIGFLLFLCVALWMVPVLETILLSRGEEWSEWYVPLLIGLCILALTTFWFRLRTANILFMGLIMVITLVPVGLLEGTTVLTIWPMWFGLLAGTLLGDRHLAAWKGLRRVSWRGGARVEISLVRHFILSLTMLGSAFLFSLLVLTLSPLFDLGTIPWFWLILASFLTLVAAALLVRTELSHH